MRNHALWPTERVLKDSCPNTLNFFFFKIRLLALPVAWNGSKSRTVSIIKRVNTWEGDESVLGMLLSIYAPGGFPGGPVVKSSPANAGAMGSIPGPGRCDMSQSNQACAPPLVRLCSRARTLQLLKPTRLDPMLHNKRSHHNENPASQTNSIFSLLQLVNPGAQQWRPSEAKHTHK